jgi:hypothetical protein
MSRAQTRIIVSGILAACGRIQGLPELQVMLRHPMKVFPSEKVEVNLDARQHYLTALLRSLPEEVLGAEQARSRADSVARFISPNYSNRTEVDTIAVNITPHGLDLAHTYSFAFAARDLTPAHRQR